MDGPDPIEIGTVLDGRYRIERVVGSGGFGTVFEAFHLRLETTVAVKVFRLPEDLSPEERAAKLRQFADEARILTKLRHDNIVRTLDQGLAPPSATGTSYPYLVMEWCGEGSLADLLDSREGVPMSLVSVLPLIDAIAAGIEHAHAQGIAHRDLKPSNVMLCKGASGQLVPRIIDFGIAKAFDLGDAPGTGDTRTRSAAIFTPAYASPEQAVGARTGPWTDVHALGLMMVEMLTGEPPYGRGGGMSIALIDPARPSPASRGVDVGALEQVIGRALSIRAQDRYADARELRRAIHGAADSVALGATHLADRRAAWGATELLTASDAPPTPPPAKRWTRRAKRVAAASGFASLFGLGFVGVFLFGRGEGGESDPEPTAVTASTLPPATASASSEPAVTSATPRSSTAPSTDSLLAETELSKLSPDAVLARMGRARIFADSEPSWDDARAQLTIHFRDGQSFGYVYLNHVPTGAVEPGAGQTLQSLVTVRGWEKYDHEHGFGLAYLIEDDYVLSMAWSPDGEARALPKFDELCAGLEHDVRGTSWASPDPATEPGGTKKFWLAATPAQVNDIELYLRIEAAGATPVLTTNGGVLVATLSQGTERGTLRSYTQDALSAANVRLDQLRRQKSHFAVVADADTRFIAEGTGRFSTKAFLDEVFIGLAPTITTN